MKRHRMHAAPIAVLLCLCVLSPSPAHAASLVLGPPAYVNGFVAVPVRFTPDRGEGAAALQFDLAYDADCFGVADVLPGGAALQAGKGAVFNTLSDGTLRVIVAGMNPNTLPEGEVAHLYFQPLDGTPGPEGFSLAEAVVSDPYGQGIGVTYGEQPVSEEPQAQFPKNAPQPAASESLSDDGVGGGGALPQEVGPAGPGSSGPVVPSIARGEWGAGGTVAEGSDGAEARGGVVQLGSGSDGQPAAGPGAARSREASGTDLRGGGAGGRARPSSQIPRPDTGPRSVPADVSRPVPVGAVGSAPVRTAAAQGTSPVAAVAVVAAGHADVPRTADPAPWNRGVAAGAGAALGLALAVLIVRRTFLRKPRAVS